MNTKISYQTLLLRSKYLKVIRKFFDSYHFYEIDTPCFKKNPSMEPYLSPFKVSSFEKSQKGYLITSPEYSLKHVLSLGFKKIYEITHCFRSEEQNSLIHTAEFLMLEFYCVGFHLEQLIEFCIDFLQYLNDHFLSFSFKKHKVHFLSVLELFQSNLGIGYSKRELIQIVLEKNLYHEQDIKNLEYQDLFFLVFFNLLEIHLNNNFLFLYDYPKELAALAKIENNVAKRFELYWNKIELANAFLELNDREEQIERLKKEQQLRKKLKKSVFNIDPIFKQCLKIGFPDCSGIAIGLDRLFMLILKQKSLKKVSPYYDQI